MPSPTSIIPHIPRLRRYACALTGSHDSGDIYVRACLEALLKSDTLIDAALSPRVALYCAFHATWLPLHAKHQDQRSSDMSRSNVKACASHISHRLASVASDQRPALLLTMLEEFTAPEAATILGCGPADIQAMCQRALNVMDDKASDRILIFKEASTPSLNLTKIVEEMGHTVSAMTSSCHDAIAAAHQQPPSLILADVPSALPRLGPDNIRTAFCHMPMPVLFITAHPERLWPVHRAAPTYMLTKPVLIDTIKATIAEALKVSAAPMADQRACA